MSIEALTEAGIEFRVETSEFLHGKPNNPKKGQISNIKLPWSAQEWHDVLDKQGKWLPMCCGNISSARDILIAALRESGWLKSSDFYEIVDLLATHDGFTPEDRGATGPTHEDPIMRLFWIYEQAEGLLELGSLDGPRELDPTSIEDAGLMIDAAAHHLHMLTFYEGWAQPDPKTGETRRAPLYYPPKKALASASHVDRIDALRKMLPAVHTLYNHLAKVDPGPFFGYALVDEHGHTQKTRGGASIYKTEDDCRQTLAVWKRSIPPDEWSDDKFRIVPCRVTVEHGFEILQAPQGELAEGEIACLNCGRKDAHPVPDACLRFKLDETERAVVRAQRDIEDAKRSASYYAEEYRKLREQKEQP